MSALEEFKGSLGEPAQKSVKDTVTASGNTLDRSPSGAFHMPSFSPKWSQKLASLLQMRERKAPKGTIHHPAINKKMLCQVEL